MVKTIFEIILIIFPFGQLLKFGIFNLFDISVFLLAMVTLFKGYKYPSWYKYFLYFLVFLVFGLLLNYKYFEVKSLFYLVRLWSYSMVAVFLSNVKIKRDEITNKLLLISILSVVFGLIQYFVFPDLTALKYFNWDDHLLRMTGTFLDPAFLGIVIVLGVHLALSKEKKLIAYLLSLSLMFTYSRASYLVLLLVFIIDLFKNKKFAWFLLLNSSFLLLLILPKNIGEGTNLARTASTQYKIINFQESVEIIKTNPLFGVGFNNICSAKQKILTTFVDPNSHSCSGLDSSILFLIATTGVIGLFLFVSFILKLPNSYLLITSFILVLVHSFFTNTLFYPHVMFWLFCLIGILKTKVNSN